MPVANNLHNENRPKRFRHKATQKKQNKKRKGGNKQTWWNIKLNHQPKKRQRCRSFILGDSNWNFFQVGYPVTTDAIFVSFLFLGWFGSFSLSFFAPSTSLSLAVLYFHQETVRCLLYSSSLRSNFLRHLVLS